MEKTWLNSINNKPKLRTYVTFKHNFETESYVNNYMSRTHRSMLAQFRLGILPLHIETGRFKNIAIENRLCTFCNSNSIEDEFHFLMACPNYNELRKTLFTSISHLHDGFADSEDKAKFIFINSHCQKQLAIYLCKAWEKRQSLLYNNVNNL